MKKPRVDKSKFISRTQLVQSDTPGLAPRARVTQHEFVVDRAGYFVPPKKTKRRASC